MSPDTKPPKRRLRKPLIVLFSFGLGLAATAIVAVPVVVVGLTSGIMGIGIMGTGIMGTGIIGGALGGVQMMTVLQSGS